MATTVAKAQKRRDNLVEEDWISQLPNEILITILSLLSFVEAASTCVLSKRWKYLWTHFEVLNFEFPKRLMAIQIEPPKSEVLVQERANRYLGWVNRALQLHQSTRITLFKVNFFLSRKNRCDIDEWFKFAFRKCVQRLEVNLSGSTVLPGPCPSKPYALSRKVYSLIRSPHGLSCIKSLTQLSLTCVDVSGELVEHFLSNCPLLERLCVVLSYRLFNLKVTGPSLCLKFLEITWCFCLQSVDIWAPNLASFICRGMGKTPQVLVRYAPSLVDLTIGGRVEFLNALPGFTSYFSQLESLTLTTDLRRETDAPQRFPELSNLKTLTFKAYATKWHSFLDWTSFIERSPVLHTFTLQLMSCKRIRTKIRRPTEQRIHKCLKVVEFVGDIDFELVVYFTLNAVALEKIIVDCRRPPRFEAWEEFNENERSMELRKYASVLENRLPPQVELVIRPTQGIQDPSTVVASAVMVDSAVM